MDTTLLPILTLLIGWVMANAADYVRSQKAGCSALRKAISDLLEVRHRLRGYDKAVRAIKSRIPIAIPPSAELQLRKLALRIMGFDNSFLERYTKSIDALSEIDPIFAYRLRGKEQILGFLSLIHQAGESDTFAVSLAVEMEPALIADILPVLEEIIIEAAREVDRSLPRRLTKMFSTPENADPKVEEFFARMDQMITLVIEKAKEPDKAPAKPISDTPSPQELFTRWVTGPIAALRKLDHGDGAFAALAISLGLYERFIKSILHKAAVKGTPENFRKEVSKDLSVSEEVSDRFWNSYRLGLMHAFQPKNYVQDAGQGDAWGWAISEGSGYEAYPVVEKKAEKLFIIRLDPWKFTEHVLNRWRATPELMNELEDFAFGRIQRTTESKAPADTTYRYLPPEGFRTYAERK